MRWHGVASLGGVGIALSTIREHAAAECVEGDEVLRGGSVDWHAEPFPCGDLRLASGCDWGGGVYSVLWREHVEDTALVDELGHEVWIACHYSTGEDAAHEYDPAFAEWVSETRREIGRRLGR